jgi:hypothetical protein
VSLCVNIAYKLSDQCVTVCKCFFSTYLISVPLVLQCFETADQNVAHVDSAAVLDIATSLDATQGAYVTVESRVKNTLKVSHSH